MVQIEKYDPYETDIWFYCEEGDYNLVTSAENEEVPTFTNQLNVGDYVTLDLTKNKCVKKAEDGDVVYGIVISNPKYDGTRPSQASASGEYNMRICTVRLFGYYVHNVKITAESTDDIAVGDAVKYVGNNEFDKADEGKSVALWSAKALSGIKIPVLMGLLGF